MKTANRIFGGLWMTGGLLMVAAVVLGASLVLVAPASVAISGGLYALVSGKTGIDL